MKKFETIPSDGDIMSLPVGGVMSRLAEDDEAARRLCQERQKFGGHLPCVVRRRPALVGLRQVQPSASVLVLLVVLGWRRQEKVKMERANRHLIELG